MEPDLDVRREVWHRTLTEVEHSVTKDEPERHPCVICLDDVSEPAKALPCGHVQFDFVCLASWLEERAQCPLCKSVICTVHYDIKSENDLKVYTVPQAKKETTSHRQGLRLPPRPRRPRRPRESQHRIGPELAVKRRREVYRRSLYSLHVGSNRISRFQDLSPSMFARDTELVSRARKWIRRELMVFEYLGTPLEDDPQIGFVRSNNAEFLLEYCIAILKTINVRDSSGQAEDMLQEFFGRENAKLFLHELQSWLRSPYTSLEAWDSHVQYSESLDTQPSAGFRGGDAGDDHNTSSRKRRRGIEDRYDDEDASRSAPRNASRRPGRAYDSYRPRYET